MTSEMQHRCHSTYFRLCQSARALGLTGLLLLSPGCQPKRARTAAPPEVEVTAVQQKDVPITREWVATLNGLVNAQVRAQVSGYLVRQLYRNGDFVAKGAPLFEIDPRSFQAVVNQSQAEVEGARSNVSQAQSNLQNSQAQLAKAKLDVTRYIPLAKERALSQEDLDNAIQAQREAEAQVAAAQAAISSAKAAVGSAQARLEGAQLNLGFTLIKAPISGLAGINAAQIGDLVGPDSQALTTVSTVNPILANFTASEQEYLSAMRGIIAQGKTIESVLAPFEFSLRLTDGTPYPLKGKFYAVDRNVDVSTGSITVQIQFPNPGNILRPGGFARISTTVQVERNALLVPQRAISEVQGIRFVTVVTEGNKVKITPVKVGATFGDALIVTDGLRAGDTVVVEGAQKVQDGAVVLPKQYRNNLDPQPR